MISQGMEKYQKYRNGVTAIKSLPLVRKGSLKDLANSTKETQDKNSTEENQEQEKLNKTEDQTKDPEMDTKKQEIMNILKSYPNLDMDNLDGQNLDYIAHLIGICECTKCECHTCKCPYAVNNEKYRYNFHDLKTTN